MDVVFGLFDSGVSFVLLAASRIYLPASIHVCVPTCVLTLAFFLVHSLVLSCFPAFLILFYFLVLARPSVQVIT